MLVRARSTELLSWYQFLMDESYHSTTDLTQYARRLKLPLEIISMIFDYVAPYQQICVVDERSFSGYLKQRLKLQSTCRYFRSLYSLKNIKSLELYCEIASSIPFLPQILSKLEVTRLILWSPYDRILYDVWDLLQRERITHLTISLNYSAGDTFEFKRTSSLRNLKYLTFLLSDNCALDTSQVDLLVGLINGSSNLQNLHISWRLFKSIMSLYGSSVIVDTSLITTLTLTVEQRDLSYQSTLDGNSKHSSVQLSWNPFFNDYFQLRQLNICHSIFPWLAQPQLIVDASLLCVERIHTETLIKVDLADTIFDCKCLFMDITITMWTMEQVVEYEQLLRLCPQVTLTITEASKFKGIAHECRKMQRKVYNLVNYYGNFYVKGLHESLMCDVDQ